MFSHCFEVTPEWELAFSTECAALKNIVYLEKKLVSDKSQISDSIND